MDRKQIDQWLNPHVLNVCLAAHSREENDLSLAIEMLYQRVELLVRQAVREAPTNQTKRGQP
jgi:HEPN domain-containing protein